MATEKPRYMITLENDLLDAVEKYRYENRIATRSGATVELLKLGMEALFEQNTEKEEQKNKAPTDESVAEALYEVLYYYLGQPPTAKEVATLRSLLPVICRGVGGTE